MQIPLVFECALIGFVAASLSGGITGKLILKLGMPQFINASIAQVLGYDYVEALDYSSLWYGINESIAEEINGIDIDPNAPESEIADGILKMVYGGDHANVHQTEVNQLLGEVQQKLAQIDKGWEGRLIDTANIPIKREESDSDGLNAQLEAKCDNRNTVNVTACREMFEDFVRDWQYILYDFDFPYWRSACRSVNWQGDTCCMSWLKRVHVSPEYFRSAWEPCRDTCFDRKKVSCLVRDVPGLVESDERATVCFSGRPDGCR